VNGASSNEVTLLRSPMEDEVTVSSPAALEARAIDASSNVDRSALADSKADVNSRAGFEGEKESRAIEGPASEVVESGPGDLPSDSWRDLMVESKYREIVVDAKDRGLEDVLTTVTLFDLAILADAARYAGQARVATRALLAQRERFAASSQARSAAFQLGRLAEDHLGDPRTALTWYTTYLQESPSGAFVSEALGRKMDLLSKTRGKAAAESLAQAYLQRYPQGPYATSARRILDP
jgi:hypothetical protein